MSEYTPGPWFVDEDMTVRENNNPDSEFVKLICKVKGPMDIKEQKANAQLIAAAPDLLEVAEEIVEELNAYPELTKELRQAIAKARGDTDEML